MTRLFSSKHSTKQSLRRPIRQTLVALTFRCLCRCGSDRRVLAEGANEKQRDARKCSQHGQPDKIGSNEWQDAAVNLHD
jgi:hypothetical protein